MVYQIKSDKTEGNPKTPILKSNIVSKNYE